jgi:hypothetical protein
MMTAQKEFPRLISMTFYVEEICFMAENAITLIKALLASPKIICLLKK